jgi:universal stress protein family protein
MVLGATQHDDSLTRPPKSFAALTPMLQRAAACKTALLRRRSSKSRSMQICSSWARVARAADLVIGSTALRVATHALCPVVVVPAAPVDGPIRHGVVVGVDGSDASEAAIEFACEMASQTNQKLTALHT